MWIYKEVHQKLMYMMEQIYYHLLPSGILAIDLRIRPMARTLFSKFYPNTDNGTDGIISINSRYLPPIPTENQLFYFIILIAHDLCQYVAMRENEAAKPHGKEVKKLLKKIGIAYNGTKKPFTFTKDKDGNIDSLIYAMLEDENDSAVKEIVVPEILPPPPKKEKPQQLSILDQVDQAPTSNLVEASSNASKSEQQPSCNNGQPSYEVLLKTCAEQLKTIQELRQRIESFNPSNIQQEQPQELANAAN